MAVRHFHTVKLHGDAGKSERGSEERKGGLGNERVEGKGKRK